MKLVVSIVVAGIAGCAGGYWLGFVNGQSLEAKDQAYVEVCEYVAAVDHAESRRRANSQESLLDILRLIERADRLVSSEYVAVDFRQDRVRLRQKAAAIAQGLGLSELAERLQFEAAKLSASE